jgi:hypothetical protein
MTSRYNFRKPVGFSEITRSDEIKIISKCPSPDCSGNPFMECNGIKDCNEKQETAPKSSENFNGMLFAKRGCF